MAGTQQNVKWQLSSSHVYHSLPTTMVFIGSADCDINIELENVDKRHAVITYDHYQCKYKVKDLGSSHGTYLNSRRIPEQTYITLDEGDSLVFGYNSEPWLIEKCGKQTGSPHISHDVNSSKTASAASNSARPRWDHRPPLAECQGCIQEQDLHHTCDISHHMDTDRFVSDDGVVPSSPVVSPLDLRLSRNDAVQQQHDYSGHHRHPMKHSPDAHMPDDPIVNTHVMKHHSNGRPSHTHTAALLTESVYIPSKKGTPLYGQPSWWGESDADEHNKKLLIDIQKQKEHEREQQKHVENERNLMKRSSPLGKPAAVSQVETGGDMNKGLSFTVELKSESAVDTDPATESKTGSTEKLSNFLPSNLRKSIQDRRDRLAATADRSQHPESGVVEESFTPVSTDSPASAVKPAPAVNTTSNVSKQADSSMFMINKMFYSPNDQRTEEKGGGVDDETATEYSMYPEAKSMNRSSTMPDIGTMDVFPTAMTRSRTFDDKEDKVSESGTYTIDDDNKELAAAREDIEKVFGISRGSAADESDVTASLQVEVGSNQPEDTSIPAADTTLKEGDSDEPATSAASPDLALIENSRNDTDIIVGKPPISPVSHSPEHRLSSPTSRRANGRRLPQPPTSLLDPEATSTSHSSKSEQLSRSNTMPRRKKEIEFSKERILQELGIGDSPVIEKERPKLVEELLMTRTYHRENDPIVVNKTNFFDRIVSSSAAAFSPPEQSKELPSRAHSQPKERTTSSSVRNSVDSVNTEVLLQSTDEFMKAIHSFSSTATSSSSTANGSKSVTQVGSKTKSSGTTSSLSKSTAGRLSNSLKTSTASPSTAQRSSNGVNGTRRSLPDGGVSARLSGAKNSMDRDSSKGSDESVNSNSNNVKKTPTTLSSARPNRTFELRRARTESTESDVTSVATPRSSARTINGKTSEVSLGAKIVQKSRENAVKPERNAPLRRSDGGRHSMRVTGSSSSSKPRTPLTTGSAGSNSSSKRSTPIKNSLSRAEKEKESEREKEKAAWDRRRSYDPRRAVQETDTPKDKPLASRKSIKSYPQASEPKSKQQQRPMEFKPAFDIHIEEEAEAKSRKSESRGSTPRSVNDDIPPARPRANSYGGENSSVVSNIANVSYNDQANRHSADVFNPLDGDLLKLNLAKELEMEDSMHELEIAKVSHDIAKDLAMLTKADEESSSEPTTATTNRPGKENLVEQSPETEELVNSMFAAQQHQQQKSAFSSYRPIVSATPELSSPSFSPMKKKLSTSQNLDSDSPNTLDRSYNSLVLTSIQQLSAKLQNYTASTVTRLRERGVNLSNSPSPTQEVDSEMPASSELSTILKMLKRVEQNVKVMDKALFSHAPQSDLSTVGNSEHEHYLAEIKRIRNEIAGFRPIETTSQQKKSALSGTTATKGVTKQPPAVASKPRTATNKSYTTGTSTYKKPVYY